VAWMWPPLFRPRPLPSKLKPLLSPAVSLGAVLRGTGALPAELGGSDTTPWLGGSNGQERDTRLEGNLCERKGQCCCHTLKFPISRCE
jgi:hypothetical protein